METHDSKCVSLTDNSRSAYCAIDTRGYQSVPDAKSNRHHNSLVASNNLQKRIHFITATPSVQCALVCFICFVATRHVSFITQSSVQPFVHSLSMCLRSRNNLGANWFLICKDPNGISFVSEIHAITFSGFKSIDFWRLEIQIVSVRHACRHESAWNRYCPILVHSVCVCDGTRVGHPIDALVTFAYLLSI